MYKKRFIILEDDEKISCCRLSRLNGIALTSGYAHIEKSVIAGLKTNESLSTFYWLSGLYYLSGADVPVGSTITITASIDTLTLYFRVGDTIPTKSPGFVLIGLRIPVS